MIPLLVVTLLVAAGLYAAFRRRAPTPRTTVAALDPDAIVAHIVRELDHATWTLEHDGERVRVYCARDLAAPVMGFRTVIEVERPLAVLAADLGDGLVDAMSRMNARFLDGGMVRSLGHGKRIVRTAFSMPPGIADREFVHLLYDAPRDDGTYVIAYHSVDDPDLPPPPRGMVRCPIYPSGQRLTPITPTRTRVEHLMTYELAGSISRRAQDMLFRAGHVAAYRDEWGALVRRMEAGR